MSRSGYVDDMDDNWSFICWRGAVNSALKGRRGQACLQELLDALDALPAPRLIAANLEDHGEVCALGALGKKRGVNLVALDPEDCSGIAGAFGIAEAMAREIVYINDEAGIYDETPEDRFVRVRTWIVNHLRKDSVT